MSICEKFTSASFIFAGLFFARYLPQKCMHTNAINKKSLRNQLVVVPINWALRINLEIN